MRYDATIELESPGGFTVDAIGQQVPLEPSTRTVFANRFDVSTREFYDAGAQGRKPEREYQVRTADYQGEGTVIADGIRFTVMRTKEGTEFTRLVCERTIGNG